MPPSRTLSPRGLGRSPAKSEASAKAASGTAPSDIAMSTTHPTPVRDALVQRGQDRHHRPERAARDVGHLRARHRGRLLRRAGHAQHAGAREVVEVVPRALRQRAVLAVAR